MESRGGYQTIDLQGIALTSSGVKIPGIYEAMEGNHYKPILVMNVNLNLPNKFPERFSFFACPYIEGTSFRLYFPPGTRYINIADDDTVSYVVPGSN